MVNLLGDLWINGEPDWAAALAVPDWLNAARRQKAKRGRPQNGPHYGARRYRRCGRESLVGRLKLVSTETCSLLSSGTLDRKPRDRSSQMRRAAAGRYVSV